jgi:tetratricopeptide (TPR) repeat protein
MNWAALTGLMLAGVLLGQPPPAAQEMASEASALVDRAEAALLSARAGEGALEGALLLIGKALAKSPGDYRARKAEVRSLLLQQKWAEAVEAASKLNRRMPDDLEPYGLLVEAHLRLGNRDEAARAAQWMLDLRQESPLSLWRGANVRESFAQWDGALQLLKDAYHRTPPALNLERGLLVAQMARVSARAGLGEQVERLASEAMRLAPGAQEVREALAEARGEPEGKRQ